MKSFKLYQSRYFFPVCGLLLVTLGYMPYIILGKGSVFCVTDQLDGDILTYVLSAKHLFDGKTIFPEIMCGISHKSLIPPSILSTLLYVIFSPFYAFLINQYLLSLAAFIGMYLLCNYLLQNKPVSFCTAVLFAYLPIFSVYGLSVTGAPLLLYALLKLYENKKQKRLLYYGIVVLYCFSSAFHLTGYAIVGGTILISLVSLIKGNKKNEFFGATLLLLFGYLIQDYPLLLQILGIGAREVSHREEFVIAGMNFGEAFSTMFVNGFAHGVSYHKFIILPAILTSVYGLCRYQNLSAKRRKEIKLIWGLLSAAAAIALFFALFHCHTIVNLRNHIGGILKSFQADRVYWFYPVIWYLILACMCAFIYEQMHRKHIAQILCLSLFAVTGLFVLWNSDFKKNFRQMINSETSNQITWKDFYSEDLFLEIADFVKAQKGLSQDEYRVACVGFHPAVAVMNGFYTIDGYSNNYSLDYKHKFREVIAYELSQNEYNRIYFDEWGNRCYIFASDYNGNIILGKDNHAVLHDFILQNQKLRELGCRYIFSAGEIAEPELSGLTLCRVFEREDSYYRIYLYAVS